MGRAASLLVPPRGTAGTDTAASRLGHDTRGSRPPVTYAITCDRDTKVLESSYPSAPSQYVRKDVEKFLREEGFDRQQGSVDFGGDEVDVVPCRMAMRKPTLAFPWFGPSVSDIRMPRIEDNDDLMHPVELVKQMKGA
jgi:virulence-associated protein VapD